VGLPPRTCPKIAPATTLWSFNEEMLRDVGGVVAMSLGRRGIRAQEAAVSADSATPFRLVPERFHYPAYSIIGRVTASRSLERRHCRFAAITRCWSSWTALSCAPGARLRMFRAPIPAFDPQGNLWYVMPLTASSSRLRRPHHGTLGTSRP
jgi:hypothetical protein